MEPRRGKTGRENLPQVGLYWRWLSAFFIFAVILGASHNPRGASGWLIGFVRESIDRDVSLETIKAAWSKLTGALNSVRDLDITSFWSKAVFSPQSNLSWPADGPVTCFFGWRDDPESGNVILHQGIDIECAKGSPVTAAGDGTVVSISNSPSYGLVVEISHGRDITTLYAHLDSVVVSKGQRVRRGDIIGRSGDSGNATGAHLHFEVRKSGVEVDPMTLLPPRVKSP